MLHRDRLQQPEGNGRDDSYVILPLFLFYLLGGFLRFSVWLSDLNVI